MSHVAFLLKLMIFAWFFLQQIYFWSFYFETHVFFWILATLSVKFFSFFRHKSVYFFSQFFEKIRLKCFEHEFSCFYRVKMVSHRPLLVLKRRLSIEWIDWFFLDDLWRHSFEFTAHIVLLFFIESLIPECIQWLFFALNELQNSLVNIC